MCATTERIKMNAKKTYEVYPLFGNAHGKVAFTSNSEDEVFQFCIDNKKQDYVIFNTETKELTYSSFEAKCKAYSVPTLSESIDLDVNITILHLPVTSVKEGDIFDVKEFYPLGEHGEGKVLCVTPCMDQRFVKISYMHNGSLKYLSVVKTSEFSIMRVN